MEIVDMSEDVVALASTQLRWLPYHFHGLRVQPQLFILIINPSKKEGLETHLAEESSRRGMMSEGIDMPSNTRHIVERFLEPS